MRFWKAGSLLVLAAAGCARVTQQAAGAPDGVNCVVWRAKQSALGAGVSWVYCIDREGKLEPMYAFGTDSLLTPVFSALGSAVP